jgi:hypothetical protein
MASNDNNKCKQEEVEELATTMKKRLFGDDDNGNDSSGESKEEMEPEMEAEEDSLEELINQPDSSEEK